MTKHGQSLPASHAKGVKIVALCGGVGGAKLALGLASVLPRGTLTLIVNTGDDFIHLGLHVSPDVDTVVYTLSDLVDQERGWGRREESWAFMQELERLGSETWFLLGDRDLAMHVERTRALASGETLSAFTERIAARLDVPATVLPMTDQPVRTMVETNAGEMEFQRYFVERRCAPEIRAIRFQGSSDAAPSPKVAASLTDPELGAVIICPSNPYLSIDPILSVNGMRALLRKTGAPCIAVSPIIAGDAVKGPTRKVMNELGIEVTNDSIAAHYAGMIDGLVVHPGDALRAGADVATISTPTLMLSLEDKTRLASDVLHFAAELSARSRKRAT